MRVKRRETLAPNKLGIGTAAPRYGSLDKLVDKTVDNSLRTRETLALFRESLALFRESLALTFKNSRFLSMKSAAYGEGKNP